MIRKRLIILCVIFVAPGKSQAETNVWLAADPNRPTDWEVGSNWSLHKVPKAGDGMDVRIPPNPGKSPQLSRDAAVGGSLTIGENARLILNGHSITVGAGFRDSIDGPNTSYSSRNPRGLVIGKGAILSASRGKYNHPAGWVREPREDFR